MRGRMKKLLLMAMFIFTILTGCSSNEIDLLFSDFNDYLINKDFESLYLMLSNESKELITQEEFVSRYQNIYSGINATQLEIEMGDIDHENELIPFTL